MVRKGFRQIVTPMLSRGELAKNTLMITKLSLQAVPKTKKFLRELEGGELRVSVHAKGICGLRLYIHNTFDGFLWFREVEKDVGFDRHH